MTKTSIDVRGEASEHDEKFEEAMAEGDEFCAAFHARDAIQAQMRAEELFRAEHPEVERLDTVHKDLMRCVDVLAGISKWLAGIFCVLCYIAYKLH